ncbi:MAG: hypothetical protein MK297_04060 [Planctomycetes bacterium]|nr:hypothetical protein [Planctomycetota bacterium]
MNARKAISTRLFICLATVALFLSEAPFANAQAPKLGREYYEDNVDLGFKVKMPKDWEFIPPQPGQDEQIGKFTPEFNKRIDFAGGRDSLWLDAYLLKFDRRDEDDKRAFDFDRALDKAVESTYRYTARKLERIETKDLKIDKVPSKEVLYKGLTGETEVHVYAMQYFLSDDLVVAYLFDAPAERKKWRKWESSISKLCKSFKRVEVELVDGGEVKEGDSVYRSSKRGALMKEVRKNPGWQLFETENYFIITSSEDREFVKELETRLEAIRDIYEKLYPLRDAERVRLKMAKRVSEAKEQKRKEREERGEEDEGDRDRTTAGGPTPLELSRCSVVRVCKSRGQYMEYGGPPGSAGYWNYRDEELVLYDDKGGGGRGDTWAVLNHEAFHQYIFYFYGNLAPHSWYNEGTGDFFSGYQLKAGRFTLKPFDWRVQTIRDAIKADDYVPMPEFLRYTQQEYYAEGGRNYAQGWSLIYFLRTGKKNAKGWNSDWDSILDDYLNALNDAWIEVKVQNILKNGVEFGEDGRITVDFSNSDEDDARAKAVDIAIAGIDWEEFEAAWRAYTL